MPGPEIPRSLIANLDLDEESDRLQTDARPDSMAAPVNRNVAMSEPAPSPPTIFHRIVRLRPRRVWRIYYGIFAVALALLIAVIVWQPPRKQVAAIYRAMSPEARARIAVSDMSSLSRLAGDGTFVILGLEDTPAVEKPAIWFVHDRWRVCANAAAKQLTPDLPTLDESGAIDWDRAGLSRDSLRAETIGVEQVIDATRQTR